MNQTDIQRLTSLRDAIDAHLSGKPVQVSGEGSFWEDVKRPRFEGGYYWRPKPAPKTRPWTADDVPPVCWIRMKDRQHPNASLEAMIVSVSFVGVSVHTNDVRFVAWNKLDSYEWSATRKDGSWHPCVAEVPE